MTLTKEEKKVLKIVEEIVDKNLYTTAIAEKYDTQDYEDGHQNKTYEILVSLEKKGFVCSKKKDPNIRSSKHFWYPTWYPKK